MLELVAKGITDITPRIKLFHLDSASGAPLPAYTPGSHLTFDLGELGVRSYSLIDWPDSAGGYRIAVQREDDGQGGSKAMHDLNVGDTITATPPKNDFELVAGDGPFLLLAGGIGVTPMISFATDLQARGATFDFHFTTRSADVCPFDAELKAHFEPLRLWHDDSKPIDLQELIKSAKPNAQIYCCGPKGMIDAVREIAGAQGVPNDQIHFELFATPVAEEGDQPFEVEINDGQVFTIPPGQTIVEVLEEAGVDVMFDCQRGDCGICQTDVIDGIPDHRDVVLSDSERESNKVMQICVSRAKSARLVLDI